MELDPVPAADADAQLFDSLLVKARAGDSGAMGHLFLGLRSCLRKVTHERLPSFLRSRMSDSDVLQQIMLRAWAKFQQFRGMTKFELLQWLRTILDNVLRDFIRYWTAQRRDCRLDVSLCTEGGDEAGELPASPARAEAARRDLERWAALALQSLPEPHRQVVLLLLEGDLALDEKAERLGVLQDAVPNMEREAIRAARQHAQAWTFVEMDG
jgi:RNA polymerase sigma-70 factor, ECF subfamily